MNINKKARERRCDLIWHNELVASNVSYSIANGLIEKLVAAGTHTRNYFIKKPRYEYKRYHKPN